MAMISAASILASAVAEAASLVWMELAMVLLSALCYVFFVGLPGLTSAKSLAAKAIEVPGSSAQRPADHRINPSPPDDQASSALAAWEHAKVPCEAPVQLDLARVLDAMRKAGKSASDVAEELRTGLGKNSELLPCIAALPSVLLRDDSVELLDSVLVLLEEHGHIAETTIYGGLMAAQLRRRNYARVAATGARVPADALTPRMLTILASAAAQRGHLDEALEHLLQLRAPEEGAKSPLAVAVALQVLAVAAKEKRVSAALEELLRLHIQIEDKHFEEFVAAHGRRCGAETCEELLRAAVALGVSNDSARSALTKVQAGRSSGGCGSTELQRAASLIKAHAKERNLESAAAVFERLRTSGTTMTPLIYNCFLDACVQCGDFQRAGDHFDEMKRLGVVDTVGFNTLLKAHLVRGHTEEARNLVKEMSEHGLSPNRVTYNELLHAKVVAKDRAGMWRIVEEMQGASVQPNAVTCSIILKSLVGYTQVADLRRVIDLIQTVEEAVDEVLFSSVIEACIRIEQLDLLSDLMRRFRQQGSCVTLSAPTYGSMIKAYGQAGDAARVQELWAEMQEKGVKPTSITLGCLTEALVVNNKAQEAWDLVREQMEHEERRGCINTVIYSTVLKGFAVVKNMDKVFKVYDEMRSHGIPCNTITYNTMLDACAKSYAMSRASHLLEDMAATCVEPDIITYSTIIKGYCVEGDLDRAFHILEEMKKDGKLQPDEIMYNSILDGCAKQHRAEDALKVLEEMKASGIRPSNYTLSILVKVLGHARRLGQAFEMVDGLSKQNGFRPNVQVYTCLVQACTHNRRLDRALSLHDTMVADVGCAVDEKFYAVLARCCLQMRQPLKAVEVARAAYQLPGHGLARSARRDGRAVGMEASVLQELGAKLQAGSREEQQVWSKLSVDLERAGVRISCGTGNRDMRRSRTDAGGAVASYGRGGR